jgi:hypothetical protein
MRKRLSLTSLMALVGFIIVASFSLASYALYVSITDRNARIAENAAVAAMNTRRSERNCERIRAIVNVVDNLAPGTMLAARLDEINGRYPDVQPCNHK